MVFSKKIVPTNTRPRIKNHFHRSILIFDLIQCSAPSATVSDGAYLKTTKFETVSDYQGPV